MLYVATAANVGIAISKFASGIVSGSSSMVAEGIHSVADTGNEILLLLGHRRAAKPPDNTHPFGHGKALYFWAFIAAVCMFVLGGGISIYRGALNLMSPPPLGPLLWNCVVLAVAALFESVSWWVSRKELLKRRRDEQSVWDRVRASKNPSIFMVFVEDSAALVGIGVALLGVLLGHWLHNPYIDPAASVLIGAVMVAAATVLAREVGALLVGEGMDRRYIKELRAILGQGRGVKWVGDVLTMQLSPSEILLTAEVGFATDLNTVELAAAIDRLERDIRAKHPAIQRIFIEPKAIAA